MAEHEHSVESCLRELATLFTGGKFTIGMLGCIFFLLKFVTDALLKPDNVLFGDNPQQQFGVEVAVVDLHKAVHGAPPAVTFGLMDDKAMGFSAGGAIISLLLPLLLKLLEAWINANKANPATAPAPQ